MGEAMTGPIRAVPKPESTKKSKSSKGTTTKTVNMAAVDERRRAQNEANRQFGKATERRVANKAGGERTPLSGAVKTSNRNLTGDVEIRDAKGRDFMKLEVKASARVTASGDKIFSIKLPVLRQAFTEADDAHEIGALVFHFKNDDEDYFIMRGKDIYELIRLAKLGSLYEAMIERDNSV